MTHATLLLTAASAGIVLLLVLVMWLRLHAFVALLLVSLMVAVIAGMPLSEIVDNLEEGMGSTLVRTTFGFRLPFFGPFAIADMAGLDVYNFCYKSLQTDFPERFATPKVLSDLVDQGKLGAKSGGGFTNVPADRIPELIAYRNRTYVKMQALMKALGPAPI